ncbi:A disintegrin and metalloproteinase with thrombospondin motifs adt-2-like isoform X3 [Centruroides vittatus]|uniref:A disintegrin and metalloproteinase with thrombospondin motifs adt-2-like isoform X3 n=1 Tax=Centruroides vittatus TaxID=120091 RepID=UPI0035101081
MKFKLLIFIYFLQILWEENLVTSKENNVTLGDTFYPVIYSMPKNETDVSSNEHGKLVIIKTRRAVFYVELYPNYNLLSNNFEESKIFNHSNVPCLFQGPIVSHKGGMAAISICHGDGILHGTLLLTEETYFIKPLSVVRTDMKLSANQKSPVLHILSKVLRTETDICGTNESGREIITKNKILNRNKRSANKYTIETAVFIDERLKHHYTEKSFKTNAVVLNILNQMQLVFKYGSLNVPIRITIVELNKLNYRKKTSKKVDAVKYLKEFCKWQSDKKKESNTKWDLAILLTGFDIYRGFKKDIVGLAYRNQMCTESACVIAEGFQFDASLILAHEIGHSLSMKHDGAGNSCDPGKYIMSPSIGGGKTKWSKCSNEYLRDFLRTETSNCLRKTSIRRNFLKKVNQFPGEKYPPKAQCHLSTGKDSFPFLENSSDNICSLLWCMNKKWRISSHPALDGSKCGPNKICFEGDCIPKNNIKSYNYY